MFAGQEFVEPVAQVVLALGQRTPSASYAMLKLAVEQGYLDQPSEGDASGAPPTITKLGIELLATFALQQLPTAKLDQSLG
jgi:hypothetical protein